MSRKVAWISNVSMQDKSWGNERSWTFPGHVYNKIIKIKSGHKTSLKRYKVKNESFYLLSGKVAVTYGDERTTDPALMEHGILDINQVLSIPSMCPYSLEALEDSVLIETSDYPRSDYETLEDKND